MLNNSAAPLLVAKFGGTSVADFDAMNRSADIVLANPAVRLVVLSASAGVTNVLIALSKGNKAEGHRAYYLNEIRQIQYSIIDCLAKKAMIRKEIDQMIDNIAILAKIADLATSLALTDELVSYGELMSTLLFVEVLRQRGVAAVWFDVRNIMRTNDQFGNAEPDRHILKIQARNLLLRLKTEIIITQGFIGSEAKGRTTTLGRGGSDYSATLLGEALSAGRIDIWTDVPGIYTTDPRVVPTAKRINEISFEEVAEMTAFGAKILHPATLLPAVRSSIPIFVGSSKEPRAGGTLICHHTDNSPLFRALSLRRCQTLLTLHSLNMLHVRNFLAKVFNIFARHAVSVDFITTSAVSLTITMNTVGHNTNGANLLTQGLLADLSSLCRIEIEEDLALVALIGNKLSQTYGVRKKVFGTLELFNIRFIYCGASSHNLCLLVPGTDADQVVQTLHSALFDRISSIPSTVRKYRQPAVSKYRYFSELPIRTFYPILARYRLPSRTTR